MLTITSKIKLDKSAVQAKNFTDFFTQDELDRIGVYCWDGWKADCRSRDHWLQRNEAGMDLAMQIQKDKSFPWPGASNVIFPLISIAALQFSARAYGNIVQAPDLVQYNILTGDMDEEVIDRAERLGRHMSFQLLEQDVAWEEQHDRLLINLAIVGTAFIKSRYNSILRHNVGELVLARDLVVNYWTKDLKTSPRITQEIEVSRNDAVSSMRSGIYRDCQDEEWFKQDQRGAAIHDSDTEKDNRRGLDPNLQPDAANPFQFIEQHVDLDLDCDGYAEPWIITVDRNSKKVVRIVLNADREEAIQRNSKGEIITVFKTDYFTKYSFIPAPDGGFYDVGFGVLMGPLNEGVNTAINQLFDAGTLKNLGGGFLGRGAKLKGGKMMFAPGEWKQVDSTGDDLRKSMVPMPTGEPSAVLFNLLGLLIEYTNLLAGSTDTVLGKNPGQNTPAETSRNMMDSGLQIYSTIFKRIWRAMKEEFRKYHILNRMFLPDVTTFGQGKYKIKREDYLTNPDWVRPCADPNVVSAGQRLNQALMVREAAYTAPGGYDIEAVEKNYLKALRVQNWEELYPGLEKFPPSPDGKLEIEKMKQETDQMRLQLDQWKFVKEWQEAIRLNSAKIDLLEAQTASLFSEMQEGMADQARQNYLAFIEGLRAHNDMLTDRVRATVEVLESESKKMEKSDGPSKTKPKGRTSPSVRRLAHIASGGSVSPSAREMAGGDAGPVGLGLPGGFTK